jgi:transporter family-2 protein
VFTVFVAAQFAMGALVDHFGWMGSVARPLTATKAVGIAVMLVGVWLVLRD